jgi:hypothetical protein
MCRKFSVGQEPDPPNYSCNEIFRQCRSTALQNHLPFATRYSPLAIRYPLPFYQSPFAVVPAPCPLSPAPSSVRRFNIFAHDSETDEGSIGEPPLALGNLRVRCLPIWRREFSGAGVNFFRWVFERPSSDDGFPVNAYTPLSDIAQHVVDAPRVGLLLRHRLSLCA